MKRILSFLSILLVATSALAQSPFGYPGTVTPFNTTPNFRAGVLLPDTTNIGNFRLRGDTLQVKVNGVWQAASSGGSSQSDAFTGTLANARLLTTEPSTLFITDYGSGVFVKNDTVTVDNTGTQIVTAGGQGYSRIYEGGLDVTWFGGKGDWDSVSGTNNYNAITFAISSAQTGQRVYVPDGNYYIDSTIEIPTGKDINIESDGNLFFGEGFGFNIENAWQNKVTFNIKGTIYGTNTGTNYDSFSVGTAVRISNSYNNDFYFNEISGFYTAIQIGGKGTIYNGSQYNKISFKYLRRNRTGIYLKSEGDQALWCNENLFYGGKISGKYGVLSEKIATQTDPFNGNKFYNVGFEAITERAIRLSFARHNIFYSARLSGSESPTSLPLLYLDSNTENNQFYGAVVYEDEVEDLGLQNDIYGGIYTESGVKLNSILWGASVLGQKGTGLGHKFSNTGYAETKYNTLSFANSRYPKLFFSTALIGGVEKQVPYEGAYQNLNTATTGDLTENIGWLRANPTSNATYTFDVSELPNSSFKKVFYIDNISNNQIIITNRATSATLFTVSGSGLWLIAYTSGNWAAYKIGSSGTSQPFVNNGNSFGTNGILGTNDNFNLFLRANGINSIRINPDGNAAFQDPALVWRNQSATNNGYWTIPNSGMQIWRSQADANPALQINQNQSASTGDILDGRKAGIKVFNFDALGRLARKADTFTTGGKDFIVKNRTNGRDEIFSGDSIYTKSQTDSAIAAGGGSVFAKNGVHLKIDTVKLGLELSHPYTNGLITEPTYVVAGDILSGAIYGFQIDPTSVANPLILGGKIRNTDVVIGFGDPTGISADNTMDLIVDDGLGNRTDFRILKDSISIISANPNFSGMVYAGDHSTRFNSDDRAIPDVGWVRSQMADTNYVGSASTLALSKKGYYSFTGTTTTWNLPAVAASVTGNYKIANMGSGNITLNAATNTIWEAGTVMSSTTIAPGETMFIYSNGTYWTIYN